MKYAINYVLGRETHVLVVDATDRDDAYDEARSWLVRNRLFGASLQGSCRPASQDDIDAFEHGETGRYSPNPSLSAAPPPPSARKKKTALEFVRRLAHEDEPFDPEKPPDVRGTRRDFVGNRARQSPNPSLSSALVPWKRKPKPSGAELALGGGLVARRVSVGKRAFTHAPEETWEAGGERLRIYNDQRLGRWFAHTGGSVSAAEKATANRLAEARNQMPGYTSNARRRQTRNHGGVTQLHAQPYVGGSGFYMGSSEEFVAGMQKLNRRGIEEVEIQFIDGTKGLSELFRALEISQIQVELWFDEIEHLEEHEQATLFHLATNGELRGEDLAEKVEALKEGELDEVAQEGTLEDKAQEFLDEGMISEEQLAQYFDYEAFGRDLRSDDLCGHTESDEEREECEENYENMSDRELGEEFIDNAYGSAEKWWEQIQKSKRNAYDRRGKQQAEEAEEQFKRYFDVESYARDLDMNGDYHEFRFDNKTWVIG